jgi:predicted methyltransferase
MTVAVYYLYSNTAREILTAISDRRDCLEVSVDLNKSTRIVAIQGDRAEFDAFNILNKNQLRHISEKADRIFILENNKIRVLEYREGGYYKLVPTGHAPTVEIDGIKMHRSKGIDPFEDAKLKVSEVVKGGDRVLDTCGGLGYTAIWAVRLGAREVVSVEHNKFIQKLRSENPWSEEICDRRIHLISADISEYIREFQDECFDSVIHDPPRLSLAGELYGKMFYQELYRILIKGGRVFHYTGTPYVVRRGGAFMANVAKRLESVGFRNVRAREHLLGIKAMK